MNELKYCKFCDKEKPVKDFCKSGLAIKNICKECQNKKQTQIYRNSKKVDKLKQENKQLKSQWNKLKEYIRETKLKEFEKSYGKRCGRVFTQAEIVVCNMILDKIQELEGSGSNEKKTIVFDFDGVIHTGYTGWKDGSIYGNIDIDLIEYIKFLMKDYYIVISSNRPARQIVEHLNKLNLSIIFEVFKKDLNDNMYWNKDDVVGVTNEKAVGILYIDDRGYRYDGLKNLRKFIGDSNVKD